MIWLVVAEAVISPQLSQWVPKYTLRIGTEPLFLVFGEETKVNKS